MMRSLFSGVSGLRVHQSRMDVIGHNIANVNTVGFKAARMLFSDAMYQRVSGATSDNPDTGRAGRNPMQVGLGANIKSISSLMNQGAAQRTDRSLDLTIQGNGFFVVSDESGTFFTRAGNVDWNGHMFSINGMRLMGWNAIEDPTRPGQFMIEQGAVQPLVTGPEIHFMDPEATTLINALGNLNVDDLVDGAIVRPVEFYDSIGNRYVADVRFRWHPPVGHADAPPAGTAGATFSDNTASRWSMEFLPGGAATNITNQVMVFPNGNRDAGIMVNMEFGWPEDVIVEGASPDDRGTRMDISFSPETGRLQGFTLGGAAPGTAGFLSRPEIGLFFSVPALAPPSVLGEDPEVNVPPNFNSGMVRFNFSALRQHGGIGTSIQILAADGNPPGELTDISVGADGIITARYSNGEMRPIGQIPLAHFLNPEGLERVGNNLWITTGNSGLFDGVGNHADLIAGTLEMSNVDLAGEFTEMITTQRGFQANSRIITTSDEMLQELVNLKR